MGFWQTAKTWMSTEAAELKDATDDLESRLDQELASRERRLNESPSETMERLQAENEANESMFGELGDKIAGAQAKADAIADLANDAGEGIIGPDDEEIVIEADETEEA